MLYHTISLCVYIYSDPKGCDAGVEVKEAGASGGAMLMWLAVYWASSVSEERVCYIPIHIHMCIYLR